MLAVGWVEPRPILNTSAGSVIGETQHLSQVRSPLYLRKRSHFEHRQSIWELYQIRLNNHRNFRGARPCAPTSGNNFTGQSIGFDISDRPSSHHPQERSLLIHHNRGRSPSDIDQTFLNSEFCTLHSLSF